MSDSNLYGTGRRKRSIARVFLKSGTGNILINGKIVAAAQEERFTRKKHDPGYPQNAINFVLNYANLKRLFSIFQART